MNPPLLLTLKDVRDMTKLGRTKIYELIRDGRLPVVRIDKSVRVRREALDAWIEQLEEQSTDGGFVGMAAPQPLIGHRSLTSRKG